VPLNTAPAAPGLAGALERGELRLDYLPIVQLGTGMVEGVEALLRWDHQLGRLHHTATFLEGAERSGELVGVGHWVLATALRDVAEVGVAANGEPLRVSVNLSLTELVHPALPAAVARALEDCGHPPEALYLEVSERAVVHDVDRVLHAMETLKSLGARISIDDFGTGTSSLALLQSLPVDELKIDRSFVSRMHEDPRSAAIARGVAYLARSLQIRTLAEGVEEEAQERMLLGLRCTSAQGWLYAKAVPGVRAAIEAVDGGRVRDRTGTRVGALWSELHAESAAEHLVDQALTHASIGVALIDGTGTYLAVNPVLSDLLGAPPAELVGRSCWDAVHADDVAADQARLDAVLRGEAPGYVVEERYVDARGRARWVEVTVGGAPETTPGDPVRLLRQVRSIEDRRRADEATRRLAEQAVELAETNDRLARFASSLSHDLQQPLTALGGFLHLLAEHGGVDREGPPGEWLDAAQRTHRRLADAVHALLDTSLGTEVAVAPVDLANVFAGVVADLDGELQAAGATVEIDPLPPVLGDRAMLERVAANLVANACRYRADERPLHVRVSHRHDDGGRVTVVVADNGRGFSPDELDTVFAAGRRGSASEGRPGTGTGLAIVRAVVNGLGGHAWAEAGPGHGAVVCLALPRAVGNEVP